MQRLILTLPFAYLLASCAAQEPITDESDFRMGIPTGSRFTLTQDVTVPEGWARVTIQNGAVVDSRRDINRSQPFCELGTDSVSRGEPQVVTADEFVGGSAVRSRSTTIGREDKTYTTRITLRSEQQPNVRTLTCEQTGDPMFSRDLTITQIRTALGGIIELQLAQ